MNIYDFLRFLTQTLASLGPVKKEDAFNAVDLVNQLEKMSAFGEIGRITTGAHQFTINNQVLYANRHLYQSYVLECSICGKDESSHE